MRRRQAALRPPACLPRHGRRRREDLPLLLDALPLPGRPRRRPRPSRPATSTARSPPEPDDAAVPAAPSSPSERHPIVVAGAGIGGLTAALALAARRLPRHRRRAHGGAQRGRRRHPDLAPMPAACSPASASTRRWREAAIEPAAIDILNGVSGRRLTAVPASAFRRRYGFPYRVIHRADLQSLLAAAVSAHAGDPPPSRHHGRRLAAPMPTGCCVRLKRQGGGEVVAGSGADRRRRRVVGAAPGASPAAPRPSPIGRTAWRALVPADNGTGVPDTARVGAVARSRRPSRPLSGGARHGGQPRRRGRRRMGAAGLERARRPGRDPRPLRRLVRRRAPADRRARRPGRNMPSPRSTRPGRG